MNQLKLKQAPYVINCYPEILNFVSEKKGNKIYALGTDVSFLCELKESDQIIHEYPWLSRASANGIDTFYNSNSYFVNGTIYCYLSIPLEDCDPSSQKIHRILKFEKCSSEPWMDQYRKRYYLSDKNMPPTVLDYDQPEKDEDYYMDEWMLEQEDTEDEEEEEKDNNIEQDSLENDEFPREEL